MEEIWKDIESYEGLYQISNLGRVKSLGKGKSNNSKERIMKAGKDKKNGYLSVILYKDGKKKYCKVHRLVAFVFLPNPDNLPQVNHIDEDKTNNRVENLEFCDAKYNSNYGTRTQRVSKSQTNYPNKSKKVLCVETGKIYPSIHQVQRELGFSHGNISSVCSGRREQAYGFHWRYID